MSDLFILPSIRLFVCAIGMASRSNTFNRKGSGLNLTGTLRLLSVHVKHLKSEKLATGVTRLLSSIQQNGNAKSSLASIYLYPMSKDKQKTIENAANGECAVGCMRYDVMWV